MSRTDLLLCQNCQDVCAGLAGTLPANHPGRARIIRQTRAERARQCPRCRELAR